MARPLPKTNAPALVKKNRISQRTLVCASMAAAAERIVRLRAAGVIPKVGKRARTQDGGQQEEFGELRLSDRGHDEEHAEDGPQQRVAAVDLPGELIGGDGDDADDGGGDAVEDGLHPPQATERDVERGE